MSEVVREEVRNRNAFASKNVSAVLLLINAYVHIMYSYWFQGGGGGAKGSSPDLSN